MSRRAYFFAILACLVVLCVAYIVGTGINAAAAGEADAAQHERHGIFADTPETDYSALIAAHKVCIGMTRKQASQAWGQPPRVVLSETTAGDREQWIYEHHSGNSYLFFVNDRLVAVQQ